MQYLRAVISKAKAMQQLSSLNRDREIFSQTINLSDLFRPDTFLNALRQQTARESKQPMDALVLSASWSGEVKHAKTSSMKISGLQLEGCSFDGGRLTESAPDSASVTAFPSCYIAWIPRVNLSKNLSIGSSSLFRMQHNKKHVNQFLCLFISTLIVRRL